MTREAILEALRANVPFRGLPGISVGALEPGPSPLDVAFYLNWGGSRVSVLGVIKSACTPKLIHEIGPWLAGMKNMRKDAAYAVICPALSVQAQSACAESNIDFIDLAGNVSIQVPERLLLQRVGLKSKAFARPALFRDPFSGKSSRVLRVLLERPREWILKEIAQELAAESRRNPAGVWDFGLSMSSASKTVRSLEEELLVRRRNLKILTPEPSRLLRRWAEKYKERYRWYLRRSFRCPNPFGSQLQAVAGGLRQLLGGNRFAFTGAAAVARAPFVDLDMIDVFVDPGTEAKLGSLEGQAGAAPELRVMRPYDTGVFMYPQMTEETPLVSDIQAYLDLSARGGRDSKQAEYLLRHVIEPRWGQT